MRKLILWAVAATAMVLLLTPVVASAQDGPEPITDSNSAQVVAGETELFELPPGIVSLLTGLVIPLGTAVLTSPRWSSKVKMLVTTALAALSALVTTGITAGEGGSALISNLTFYNFAIALGTAFLAYDKGWGKYGVAQKVQSATTPGSR